MEPLFDKEVGIRYCGGEIGLFREVLTVFEHELEKLIPELKQLYEKKNWKNYTVRAHGLKNSAITVGAVSLSEESKKMEFAGKEERYEDIMQTFNDYCGLMEKTLQLIREYLKED